MICPLNERRVDQVAPVAMLGAANQRIAPEVLAQFCCKLDRRVVFTNCKNNDGELAARSAWERRNGLFVPVNQFDRKRCDGDGKQEKKVVTEEPNCEVFDGGNTRMKLGDAVKKLQTVADMGAAA